MAPVTAALSALPFVNRWRRWLAALIVAGLVALLAGWQGWPGAAAFQLLLEAIVVVIALQLRRRLARPSAGQQRTTTALFPAWDALSVGLAVWWVGRAVSAVIQAFVPLTSPSPVDLLRILGYPFLAVGLWRYPVAARDQSTRLRVILDLIIIAGSAATVAYDLTLRPLLNPGASEPLAVIVWSLVYPTLGLALTLVAIAAFFRPPPVALPASLLSLVLGVLIGLNFSPAIGQTLIGCGALFAGTWPDRDLPRPGGRRARLTHLVQRILPVAAVLAVFLETLTIQILVSPTDPTSLYFAILFCVLIVVRQGVLLSEVDLQRYAQLVTNAADAAFICRQDGTLILANPAAHSLLGLRADAPLGTRNLSDIFQPLPPATVPEILTSARQQSWHGEGAAPNYNRPISIALSLNALRDESGVAAGLVGVIHDVTERRHMESKMRALNAQLTEAHGRLLRLNADLELKVTERTDHLEEVNRQLEAKNTELQKLDELKSEFISLVSHELRAPLTNLNGGLELMLSREDGMSARTREALTLMSREADRLTRLVEAILDVSAFEAGELPIRPGPLALPLLIQTIVEQFRDTEHYLRLVVKLPDTLPAVVADERGLHSVIYQLIDNAFKYAAESPVEISAVSDETGVALRVIDHGPGVPEDQQSKVFERFHRAGQSDSQKVYGYGLGLYTSRRFMEGMGGQITLENTPGGGATFCVTLRRFEQ
jgi:PAS domain S-box-containing protein